MATAILGAARPSVQPQFCRVNHCAAMFGLSVQTIRNYADNPANGVEVRRSPGGHRYVNLAQIAEVFGFNVGADAGEEAEPVSQGKVCVLYSRVSTRSQCIDKNLERQAARLR